ncbi:MAG: UvrD-helicase domain-containing protein [Gammaproteobacteria bacterium]
MEHSQLAASPQHSATVMASAGTGKTWLLVTRLVRLLLEGASPDSILAITFTRKAAAEMASRLTDRLHDLCAMEPENRAQALRGMGIEPTEALLADAAGLYEKYLFEPHQLRVTTFHAFCQELLRRFPLEADVPAGFEVLDGVRLMEETAWEALVDEATRAPDSPLARDLEILFQCFNGHYGTKQSLMRFLYHRGDWWAYTCGETDPADHASQTLADQLMVDTNGDPLDDGLTAVLRARLQTYAEMLLRHRTATFSKAAGHIQTALLHELDIQERLALLDQALLRKSTTPKPSKSLVKSLGVDGQDRLIALHEGLSAWFTDIQDQYRRRRTLGLSRSWFRAGARLLDHYQRLKVEQRVLDFSDLEWKAYLLLNHADHTLWIQYKLDQRIDHLLVDEFQDTNPTQWHLIFPLLQELASGEQHRRRSVFLVGDAKQSIYRFRRAEPDLFPAAQDWLRKHLHAVDHSLSASWRSAPAIIEFVNAMFGKDPLRSLLAEFHEHTTHRSSLWGRVEIMPLIMDENREQAAVVGLRNPLRQPRELILDRRHRREGDVIAARIHALLGQGTIVGEGAATRPLGYDDIMILVRHRTHVLAYEEALRAAGIPHISASRGTLLDSIEIGDMAALLQILILPYHNLSLATILRSPLFDCSDDDLMTLAREPGDYWLERLSSLAPRQAPGTPLARAAYWLPRWQKLSGERPVHDLLDRIYSEGDVVARYEAALPDHLRSRVRANLTRFIELALETDSGRYPSLTTFIRRLATLREQEDDAPDEAVESSAAGSVRLLTIHAAKGLEAAVVFLADSTTSPSTRRAYQALVRWPAHAGRPSHFLLCGKAGEIDGVTEALLEDEARQELREQTNLLYVAITRAKQMLVISGCKPNRGEELGWYGTIAGQLGDAEAIQRNGWSAESGAASPYVAPAAAVTAALSVDPRLARPVPLVSPDMEIAPSRTVDDAAGIQGDPEGRKRGLVIHRLLQLLGDGPQADSAAIRRRISAEFDLDPRLDAIDEWQAEAERIVNDPALRDWFDPACYDQAYKEVPIHYYLDTKLVYGVIDRLVIKGDHCILVDYKTHRGASADTLAALAAPYQEQLRLYTEGVRSLWPGKSVRSFLLFTACAGVYAWQEPSPP